MSMLAGATLLAGPLLGTGPAGAADVPAPAAGVPAEFGTDWHLILAFITLTILPTIIVFFLAQKHVVAGLTAGALKG